MTALRGVLCGLSLLAAACQWSELTQTVILVEAEAAVRARTDHTTLVVTKDPAGAAVEVHSDVRAPRPAEFPYVIALSPSRSHTDQVYRIEVTALERGQPVAVARLVSGYVTSETRYVRLWLEDACIDGPRCGPDQTCHAGECTDATVDPNSLADDRTHARASSELPPLHAADATRPPMMTLVDSGQLPSTPAPDMKQEAGTAEHSGAGAGDGRMVEPAPSIDAGVPPASSPAETMSMMTTDAASSLAPADAGECSTSDDCARRGPEFVDGTCIDSVCGPNPRWRCTPPSAASSVQSIALSTEVRDSLSLDPIPNLRVLVCPTLDLDCVVPLTEATTNFTGDLTVAVPAEFAGYLKVEARDYVPSLYMLPPTLPADGRLQAFPVVRREVWDTLALSVGATTDVTRGMVMLVAEDCFGMPLAGATFRSSGQDDTTVQFYVRDLLPSIEATQTSELGNGGYFNHPSGTTVVTLAMRDSGLELSQVNLVVRPGSIAVVHVRPALR